MTIEEDSVSVVLRRWRNFSGQASRHSAVTSEVTAFLQKHITHAAPIEVKTMAAVAPMAPKKGA